MAVHMVTLKVNNCRSWMVPCCVSDVIIFGAHMIICLKHAIILGVYVISHTNKHLLMT